MAELTVKADRCNLADVLSFVDRELEKLDCPPKVQIQLDIAVEELFVNIASYAYAPGEGSATVRVETEMKPRKASITFLDSGMPYNPLTKPDPDVTLSAEARRIGGLGVFMVKKSMDEVRYEHRDGQNILTIVKMIG